MELLFLLLPIAAATGWWSGRRSVEKANNKDKNKHISLFPHYLKGLNYILNEKPDKAIELFIKMLQVNADTVDTHLALGQLFRKRGETERAIRIHQNLIAREDINTVDRHQALIGLAQDYMAAGLLDRAEKILLELSLYDGLKKESLSLLLLVYQQLRDWLQAIEIARQLNEIDDKSYDKEMAHYYCELALASRHQKDPLSCEKYLKTAQRCDPSSVRVSLLQSESAMSSGDYERAIKILRRVEFQDESFIAEAVEKMVYCFAKVGDVNRLVTFFKDLLSRKPYLNLTPIIIDQLLDLDEIDAIAILTEQLKRRPNAYGLSTIISKSNKSNIDSVLSTVRAGLDTVMESDDRYLCHHCGLSGHTLYWQCPSCKIWGSIKPLQGYTA